MECQKLNQHSIITHAQKCFISVTVFKTNALKVVSCTGETTKKLTVLKHNCNTTVSLKVYTVYRGTAKEFKFA